MAISSNATGLRAGVCTSTTRPSNPYLGQIIYQTDDGQMLVWNGSSWGTLNPTANRNVIINGNFDIWQRGQNFTTDNAATRIYTADRWCARALYPNSGAVQVITRDTANVPTGSQYALKSVIGTAAVVNNSRMQLAYTIENADAVKLAGKQMVLTLQAKSIQNIDRITIQPTYNTAGGNIYDGTAISTTNFTVNTSSFTTCTVFFTMPAIGTLTTSGSAGFVISYTRSSGSAEQVGDGIYLSQVQMEVGTQATSFEQRPYGIELQLCQRYYEVSNGIVQVTAGSTGFGGNTYWSWMPYTVEKRIALNYSTNTSANGLTIKDNAGVPNQLTYWKSATQYTATNIGFEVYTNKGHAFVFNGGQTDAGLARYSWAANAEL